MAIIKWTPFDGMMDEFFEGGRWPTMHGHGFALAMDVYEDNDNIVVEAPIAGVKPEDVNVEVEDNVLTVSGTVEHKSEVDEKNYYRKEVRAGSFYRAVALPKPVKGDAATATFENGVLKITIPKAEEAKPKKIAIKIT